MNDKFAGSTVHQTEEPLDGFHGCKHDFVAFLLFICIHMYIYIYECSPEKPAKVGM